MSEPLFLLHTGQIDSGGEQDEWDCEADSGRRVDAFCRLHPGQTILLYPADAICEAVLAEREACAKVCDVLTMGDDDSPQARGAARCARAIRARGAA